MAKRVSPELERFNPVEASLTRSVLKPEADMYGTAAAARAEPAASPPAPPLEVVGRDGGREEQPDEEPGGRKESKKLTQVRRFLLTEDENATLDQLATDMGRRLGTPLTLSHLLRATATLLMHSREELLKQGGKAGPLRRPSNNDPAALVSFEHNITRLVDRAIRNSKVLE